MHVLTAGRGVVRKERASGGGEGVGAEAERDMGRGRCSPRGALQIARGRVAHAGRGRRARVCHGTRERV